MKHWAILLILITPTASAVDGGAQQYIIALQNFTTDYDCASPLAYQISLAGFQFFGIAPSVDNPNQGQQLTNYTLTPSFSSAFDNYTELHASETAAPVPFAYNFTNLDGNLDTYISDTLINGVSCINPTVLTFALNFSQPEILSQWRVGFPTRYAYNTVVPRQFILMKSDYTVISSASYTQGDIPNYGWVDMNIRDVFQKQSNYYQLSTLEDAQFQCAQSEYLLYQQYLLDYHCLVDDIQSNVYLCYYQRTDITDCKQNYYSRFHILPETDIGLDDIFNQGLIHMVVLVAFLGIITGVLLLQF